MWIQPTTVISYQPIQWFHLNVNVAGWYAPEQDAVESDRTISYLIENQWKLSQSNQTLCPDDDYIDGFSVLFFCMQTPKI